MEEIKKTLLEGKPYFSKTKDGRYFSIGKFNRYISVVFNHNKFNESEIITAYPSSDWQIKLHKRKS